MDPISAFAIAMESESGFYHDGIWNSLIVKGGKNYRHRVEILVLNTDDFGVYSSVFVSPSDKGYDIPGGSTEKGVTPLIQVLNELHEEAFIDATDVEQMGRYTQLYHPRPEWMNALPVKYDGAICDVFVGVYSGTIDPKSIDRADKSAHIAAGDFHALKDVFKKLRAPHQDAILQYMGVSDPSKF